MNACENIVRLSRELGLTRSLLYKWRYRLEPPDAQVEGVVSTQNSRESRLRREVNKLKRLLADKTLEVDFFRSALQKVEARRQQSGISGEKASTTKSEMPLQGGLSIERMCQLAQVSRAGFYRYLGEADSPKLSKTLKRQSKGRKRWNEGSCLQSRCSPSSSSGENCSGSQRRFSNRRKRFRPCPAIPHSIPTGRRAIFWR